MWINKPKVEIVLDSISPSGARLTTFQVEYWRPILPEMNTHRVFSRNASSSRAVKFSRRISEVKTCPIVPAHWNAEKPGMIGGVEFSDEIKEFINQRIKTLANNVADAILDINAEVYEKTGYEIHKQYLNRYLEPFTVVRQLITSTEWDNFFKLRTAFDAQPEIKDVALEMQRLLKENKPVERDCHLPFITEDELKQYGLDLCLKISVARCARVCVHFKGTYIVEKDVNLYNMLWSSGHLSPFEHPAVAADKKDAPYFNIRGWRSLRYALETNTDFRTGVCM